MPKKMRALRRGTALTRSERKQLGPVQILVLAFDELRFNNDILPELRHLGDLEIVRLVDMAVVTKTEGGELVRVKASDLEQGEQAQLGDIVGALVGLDASAGDEESSEAAPAGRPVEARGYLGDDRTWAVADVIPAGKLSLVVLLEHRWAIPLRDTVRAAGGETIADAWIHPDDLVQITAVASGT